MSGLEPKGLKLTIKEQKIRYYMDRISQLDFEIDDELRKKKICETKIKDLKLHKSDIINRMNLMGKDLIR